MAVAWFAIPVHHSDVTDLTPYAREPAVLVYTAGFYGYVVWLLVDLGSYAGSRMRAIRRSDPFGAVAGALIAFACALGVVVMGLYVAYVATGVRRAQILVPRSVGNPAVPGADGPPGSRPPPDPDGTAPGEVDTSTT